MGNKPDQGPMFKLPAGQARTATPNGGDIVKGYGKEPLECVYNPDRGEMTPLDPRKPNKKG